MDARQAARYFAEFQFTMIIERALREGQLGVISSNRPAMERREAVGLVREHGAPG